MPVVIGVVASIILLIVLYLFVLPRMMVNAYEKRVERAKQPLTQAITSATQTFESPYFATNLTAGDHRIEDEAAQNQEFEKDKQTALAAVKAAEDAVANAKATLKKEGEDTTAFRKLPLLSLNKEYKAAADQDRSFEEYIDNAETFLDEYGQVIEFFKKENEYSIEDNTLYLTEYRPTMNRLSPNDLPGAAAVLEPLTQKHKAILEKYLAVSAPPLLSEYKNQNDAWSREDLAETEQFIAALKANDLAKVQALAGRDTNPIGDQRDVILAGIITKYHTQSDFRKRIEELRRQASLL